MKIIINIDDTDDLFMIILNRIQIMFSEST